jgi:phytoene dehydrogenase-like protein
LTAYDAVIVGAGPNGLTAAARLATLGWSVCVLEAADTIGGGCRTKELDVPGVRHDICAAAHPLGIASPAFGALQLERYGVRWRQSETAAAHPLDNGDAALLYRDLATTTAQFDNDRWATLFGPLLERWPKLVTTALSPLLQVPRHPLTLARLAPSVLPAKQIGRWLKDERAAALFAGLAAHAIQPIDQPLTTGVGLLLGAAGHRVGWPVAEGGSQTIMNALAKVIVEHGGVIRTGHPVRSRLDLPTAKATLLDTNPGQFEAITGYSGRAYRNFKHGPGSCKVDYVLSAPMPWTNPSVSTAATVHLGGTMAEILTAQQQVAAGSEADRPYVLVTQPAVADPTRRTGAGEPLWAYCHVPNGSTVDASAAIEAQFDRFAPGWRDLVKAKNVITASGFASYNQNYVGGDVAGGSMAGLRSVARPGFTLSPYRTPVEGFWLCSASTPPGAGVHGMAGWNAVTDIVATARHNGTGPT